MKAIEEKLETMEMAKLVEMRNPYQTNFLIVAAVYLKNHKKEEGEILKLASVIENKKDQLIGEIFDVNVTKQKRFYVDTQNGSNGYKRNNVITVDGLINEITTDDLSALDVRASIIPGLTRNKRQELIEKDEKMRFYSEDQKESVREEVQEIINNVIAKKIEGVEKVIRDFAEDAEADAPDNIHDIVRIFGRGRVETRPEYGAVDIEFTEEQCLSMAKRAMHVNHTAWVGRKLREERTKLTSDLLLSEDGWVKKDDGMGTIYMVLKKDSVEHAYFVTGTEEGELKEKIDSIEMS